MRSWPRRASRQRSAQEAVEQFYKGKQITVIVGSSAGGGYDIYARLLARHMGKYIPGNPNMVVSNMPGAASNTMVAHIYNVAPKDGTFIGAPQNSAIMDALFDNLLGNASGSATMRPSSSTSALPPPTTTSASRAPTRR